LWLLLPSHALAEERVYWSNLTYDRLLRSDTDGSDQSTIVSSNFTSVLGLDVDLANRKIYWTNYVGVGTSSIRRSNLDGTSAENVVTGLDTPYDVALDLTNNKVYWTDANTDEISRADLDGSNEEVILDSGDGIGHVVSIAVDGVGGKIYWADQDADSINRANLDGSGAEVLVTAVDAIDLEAPRGLALYGGKVYWVDTTNAKIQRANLDGSSEETLLSSLGSPRDLSIAADGSKMYWLNNSVSDVLRADLDGSNSETVIDAANNVQALVHVVLSPEIDITGNSVSIADGDSTPSSGDYTDFGSADTLSGSVARTFTIENTDYGRLAISGTPKVDITGSHAADFSVTALPSATVAGRSSTTFEVTFNPSATGVRSATLTIANDDADESTYNFDIQGTGTVEPEINLKGNSTSIASGDVTPSSADHTDFGETDISSGTVVRTFTIENLGSDQLTLSGTPKVAVSGANAADFTVTALPSSPIAISDSETFQVTFDPSAAGVRLATLTIQNDDLDEGTYTFSIQGTGTTPEINIKGNSVSISSGDSSPSSSDHTDFGSADIVTSGTVVRTFTIENSGDANLILSGSPKVTLSGVGAALFSVISQPSSPVASSGGTTTFQVRFAPTSIGVKSATLSIANDDTDENPYTFAISGTGIDSTDTDGDGTPDTDDDDDDNDGVSDAQEAIDGTNPLDPGSVLPVLGTTLCADWNGFFSGQMWNILEHINIDSTSKTVNSVLYSIGGITQSSKNFSVAAGGQTDLLVHDMVGRINNSYGIVCSTVSGSTPDIDGRMVYYFAIDGSYDFAFAMPFVNGLTGNQYISFNTYQPSLDVTDQNNLVTNWIQITNLETSAKSGTLSYYGQSGNVLATATVNIAAGARNDFSGHQFGQNLVGMVQWSPNDVNARFQVRNVRYLYNNPGTSDRFDSAVQISGAKGSGEPLVAPLDTSFGTAVLEVANTRSSSTSVSVIIYSSSGTALSTKNYTLPAKGSIHIVADTVLNGDVGSALVDAAATGGVIVNSLHYGRTTSGGINFIYETSGIQTLGSVLRGSYNTYLGQECDLYLMNSSASAQTAAITMTRSDGTVVLNGEVQALPAHGTLRYDLCAQDQANNYGVLMVQPSTTNSVAAYVVRKGANDAYRFSTPVRQ
jgi:hypothetical protein